MRNVLRAGTAAALTATASNDLIAAGAASRFNISSQFKPLQVGAVTLFTIVGVTLAVSVYAVVARRSRQPMRIYLPIALTALFTSWLADVGIYLAKTFPDTTGAGVLVLASLHLVAALLTLLFLNIWAARGARSRRDDATLRAAAGGAQ